MENIEYNITIFLLMNKNPNNEGYSKLYMLILT